MSDDAVERGQGVDHLDDRSPLGYVYDGSQLVATLHNREILEEFEEEESRRWYTVSRTPLGEQKMRQS